MRARFWPAIASSLIGLTLFASGPANAALAPAAGRPRAPGAPATILAQPGNAFIHLGNIANTEGDRTYLDDPAINGHPAARFLATMQLNAEGASTARDNHPMGLVYSGTIQAWSIHNEDNTTMPDPTAWNVFVPPQDDTLITQGAVPGNTSGDHTTINNALLNGEPNALLFVTPAEIPAASPFPHTLAVAYDAVHARWTIQTADGANMPTPASFYVLKASADEAAFTTVSSATHLRPDAAAIDNPLTNGNPDAMILVTQNFGTGVTNAANDHFLGVWYDATSQRWLIFNQDTAPMAAGVMFNVLVIPPRQGFQLQTQGGVANYKSRLNNPDLNGNPYARIYVMHNWNPPESPNEKFNNHPIGVFFDTTDQHWYLYNRDFAPITTTATFNVYYTWPRGNSFTISADAFNTTTVRGMTVNSPLLNNTAGAVAITSYTKYPNGTFGGDYTSPVGLLYGLDTFWHLFNTSGPAFPLYLSYNVLVPPSSQSFVVVANTGPGGNAVGGSDLLLNNPLTNNDPWALVFVTPRGSPGIYEHNLGVYYTGYYWGIFIEGSSSFVTGQAFNVFVIKRQILYLPAIRR